MYFYWNHVIFSDCVDTDGGLTDEYGTGCAYYDENPSRCGLDDDDDFKSMDMCCSCKSKYWY